ncbi:MAG: hypothetical protein IPO22_02140 [Anaerolineales bacterium]|nr:hypothetical protein [Anaerolineales bacterium]
MEFAAKFVYIGKAAISDYVLNKQGRYTETEYLTTAAHLLGAKLLKPWVLTLQGGSTILNHHENYDGTGYPNKVSDDIPVENVSPELSILMTRR